MRLKCFIVVKESLYASWHSNFYCLIRSCFVLQWVEAETEIVLKVGLVSSLPFGVVTNLQITSKHSRKSLSDLTWLLLLSVLLDL
jgi:hypothetical protein